MRYVRSLSLFGLILLATLGAAAQENASAPSSPNPFAPLNLSASPNLYTPSTPYTSSTLYAPLNLFASPSLYAILATPSSESAPLADFAPFATLAPSSDSAPLADPAPFAEPQAIQGVFKNTPWQAYVGYTFVRFYELPDVTENQNGVNATVTWFYRDWIGFDMEAMGAHGTLSGASSWTVFVGFGPRLRVPVGHNLQVFGHGLIGGTVLTPDTPYGSQGAFGYEVGGGVDLKPHHSRFALRLEGDCYGSRFFKTNQWSPKVTAGIVFDF